MDHELIHTKEDVDDLISDIHQLIDDEAPKTEVPPVPAPEKVCAEEPVQEPQPEETAEEAPAEETAHHWTDRQRVPKHVAKLQNNQQEAYAKWLAEQEEKGEEPPPVFEEELPKKKKKKAELSAEGAAAAEETAAATLPKKKGRFAAWLCGILVLLTLAAAVTAVLVIPTRPMAVTDRLHSDGAAAILLAGTDESYGNTDMLMLMTFNTAKNTLSLMSIPRDTAVLADDGIISIGTVYGRAGGGRKGIEALKQAAADCLGFLPDGCLVLRPEAVDAFVELLDTELTGEEALELVSALGKNETLDLTRVQTQRTFLLEIISRCKTLSAAVRAPQLLDALCANAETDLDTGNLLWMARAALLADSANAMQATLPGAAVEGRYMLDSETVVQSINASCNPYVRAVSADDLNLVQLPQE